MVRRGGGKEPRWMDIPYKTLYATGETPKNLWGDVLAELESKHGWAR